MRTDRLLPDRTEDGVEVSTTELVTRDRRPYVSPAAVLGVFNRLTREGWRYDWVLRRQFIAEWIDRRPYMREVFSRLRQTAVLKKQAG